MSQDAAIRRNNRLAENIAAGRSPLDAQIEKTIRETAEVNLDVPGPRVMQLFAELDRLREVLRKTHHDLGRAIYSD